MHSPGIRKRSWLDRGKIRMRGACILLIAGSGHGRARVRYRKYKDGEGEAGRGYDEGSETGINAADYAGE